MRTALGRGDLGSVAGRERTLAEVAPVLAAMGEAVGRDELIREVADRLDTDPSLVSERVRSAPKESAGWCRLQPAAMEQRGRRRRRRR